MSANRSKNQKSAQREHAKQYFDAGAKVLRDNYGDPHRPKLTHFWLAEKLDIHNNIAYQLLILLARDRICCAQLVRGPIYWLNESVSVGLVMDLMQRAKHHSIDTQNKRKLERGIVV